MNKAGPLYVRSADLEVHETNDGLVVFNPATDKVHHLNYSAGAIFELCRDRHSADELARLMADLYSLDEPPQEALEAGLRQLLDEGVLIEAVED